MNFLDQLRTLDVNDIGRWPLPVRAMAVALALVAVTAGGVFKFVYQDKVPVLERAEAEEKALRGEFEEKQRKAANYTAYQEQLAEIERSFGTMLQQLPGKTEIPNLLVDISQTGLGAGLNEKLFQPLDEIRRDFYAEKPIKISLRGSYHKFGKFVSDIAALPRIVTLHDIEIVKADDRGPDGDDLILNVTAKTYRYLEDDEVEPEQKAVEKKGPRRGPAKGRSES